jgi:hypothetical protein
MMLQQRAVGSFSSYDKTELALHKLKGNDFFMDRVSVIGKDIYHHAEFTGAKVDDHVINTDELDSDENKSGETAADGAIAGASIGGFAGLLVGLGGLLIPGVGPIMLAGATATAIATAISGGAIGALAGSLAGGLIGLGIPEDRAQFYGDRVAHGDYLVIVEGSESDIALAESILNKHGINHWYVYDLPTESVQTIRPMETATMVPLNTTRPQLRV